MAESTFSYGNIELCKSERLGSGLYGWMCKAKCDGLLCAAKIMHPTPFDLCDPGADFRKFQEEYNLLSLARHPNLVQYLAPYYDPDTRQPVLLMELCNESLTAFLERSPGPLSYHIQLNLCHDIAMALVYLHSNRLIHGDLTGKNVLVVAGPRTKITDFGMSKLSTRTTVYPGNLVYMSPEALDEERSYMATCKLDIFSFGVIAIQILSKKFPDPSSRFCSVKVAEFEEPLRQVVPESKRRQAHLRLIPDTHSLKPLVLQCLKKEGQRPSSLELSVELSQLKQSSQYTESVCEPQSSDIQQLQQQLCDQRRESKAKLQSELQQKDKIISDLKQTISAHEKQIQKLEQQSIVSGSQQQSVTRPQTTVPVPQKDIWKMKWRKGKKAPQGIATGAAVVYGNKVYFRAGWSQKVYSYQMIGGEEEWSELPDNFYSNFGMTVIDGLVTSVGGEKHGSVSNILLSLMGEGEDEEWSEILPPMPTQRTAACCVTTEKALVVAGGYKQAGLFRHGAVNTVDVMNISTKHWTTVFLPATLSCHLSGTAHGDTLYLAGNPEVKRNAPSASKTSVFTSSISKLMTTTSRVASDDVFGHHLQSLNDVIWKEIASVPVVPPSLVSFGCIVMAMGKPTSILAGFGCRLTITGIYRYDSYNNAWNVVSQMNSEYSQYIAVTLPGDRLIVIGQGKNEDIVEILE